MTIEYKTVPFLEVKAEGDGSTFSGYAAAFHNLDGTGDVITQGAFKDGLADFLSNGQICFDHGPVIGKPTAAEEDGKGLKISGKISDTAAGRDCKTLLKDGVIRKMSIGYRGTARQPATPDDVKSYWKAVGHAPNPDDLYNLENKASSLSFLKAIKLFEASPVGFPANTSADITDVPKGGLRLSEIKAEVGQLRTELKGGKAISAADCERLKSIHGHLAAHAEDLKRLLKEAGHFPEKGAAADQKDDGDKAADAAATKALENGRLALELIACDPMLR